MKGAELAAIVARDADGVVTQSDLDRRALLALVRELADALGTVGECHGCIHNGHDEAEALLAMVDGVEGVLT